VTPAIEQLKDTPASIERTIVKLEKSFDKYKDKDKDNDISALAKLWKQII
jgi:ribosome-associated translation inhibitor RaiA